MNRERFQTLADAYGGDIARWPEAQRAAAREFTHAEPAWTAARLAEAAGLDAILAQPAPGVAGDLVGRVLAAAPRPLPRWWTRWLAPAGLAAACAAGLIVGAQVSQVADVAGDEAVVTAVADDELSLYADEEA
jgi:hypothetical protein